MKALIITEKTFEGKQLREILQKLPFTEYDRNFRLDCYEMDSAKAALDKLDADAQKDQFYDFAITAHVMKKLTGLQFAQLVAQKKKLPPVHIILLAETISPQLKEEAEKAGVAAVLQSPGTMEQFEEAFGKIADAAANKALQRMEAEEGMLKMAGEDDGSAYQELCRTTAATLKRCMEMAPWRHKLNNHLARVYMGAGDWNAAIPILKNLIKLDFADKEAHRGLALCYKRTGKSLEDADSLYELAKENPESAAVRLRLAEALMTEQNFEEAEQEFRAALTLPGTANGPLKARAHFGVARALYAKAGEKPSPEASLPALAELKTALQTDTTLGGAFFLLHAILKSFGKAPEAQQALEAARKITPSVPADWLEWFFLYLNNGDAKNAEEALAKALALDPESQATRVLAGEAYFRRQEYDKAVALFERAVAINPSDIRLYNWLGICNRRLKLGVKAMENYKKALVIDPDDFNIHYNLGRVYAMQKDYANARKAYEEALRLHPGLAEAEEALSQLPAQL